MKNSVLMVMLMLLGLVFGAVTQAEAKQCIDCHIKTTPGIVEQFQSGAMGRKGFDCSICHGTDHTSAADVAKVSMPTPDTCKGCHAKQVSQYKEGKHSLAWVASSSMPMWGHQPSGITGDGYKGCSSCHKIGLKSPAEEANYHYGGGACDSCHTRHSFNKSEAQDPRACQTCHMGFDHPQWEMWSTSKHGTIWAIEGAGSKRAPTCQTCHMKDGDHNVMTSWGFLALRLPEDDAQWMGYRVKILQALGVLDMQGKPTGRLDVVKAGKVARLSKEEFQAQRDKMIGICSQCHSSAYAKKQLDDADAMIKAADELMAEAITVVQDLYKDGLLTAPEGWTIAPDLLQFFDAGTPIEQELHVMFLEYRMRTFQGAFHMNPDYVNWYGWGPMKQALTYIKDEGAKLRAEAKKK